jgi:phytoene dehydrogenase-like protein
MAAPDLTVPAVADVVVVGGGHNGLTAACYLAKAGLSVTVVEAGPVVGGMSACARPFANAPDHVVNTCSAEFIFLHRTPIVRELELERFGLRMVDSDPPYMFLHPDGSSIAYWRDARRTADEIRRFSRADAAAYLEFAELLDALLAFAGPYFLSHPYRVRPALILSLARSVVRHRKRLVELIDLVSMSGDALVETRFTHPIVKDAVYSLIGSVAPTAADGTALSAAFIAFLHSSGAMRPVGGMQALPDALSACLAAHGGTTLTGTEVSEIEVQDGKARGVVLADGRVIRAARAVVAACDARQTIGRLVPATELPERLRTAVASAPANGQGNAWVKVDVAYSGRLHLERHERWRGDGLDLRRPAIIVGEMERVRRAYGTAASGRLPAAEDLLQWIFVPTAIDPTQAPDGQDVIYMASPTMPLAPLDGWSALAEQAADRMVEQSSTYYGGLESAIERTVETPDDLVARLRVGNGCYFHVDFSPFRAGPLRPALGVGGYRTPIRGLYLSGAGTHPGGGVSGLPGMLAARCVLRDVRRRLSSGSREVAIADAAPADQPVEQDLGHALS